MSCALRIAIKRLPASLSIALLASLAALLLAWTKVGALPSPSQVREELLEDPAQSRSGTENFAFDYRGQSYAVQPQAEYLVSGVVVSHNNISGIGDIYHTSDSVDLKDLCLVWGDNVVSGIYRKFNFWSEPWSCHYQIDDGSLLKDFRNDQFSNNHLIAADKAVQDTIRSVNIGDQVRLTGLLVNYYPVKASEQIRRTSLNRTDTGNGACEVIFVKKVQILMRSTERWYMVYSWAKWALAFTTLIKLISIIVLPWLEFRFT